jgi:hypothetical protein
MFTYVCLRHVSVMTSGGKRGSDYSRGWGEARPLFLSVDCRDDEAFHCFHAETGSRARVGRTYHHYTLHLLHGEDGFPCFTFDLWCSGIGPGILWVSFYNDAAVSDLLH